PTSPLNATPFLQNLTHTTVSDARSRLAGCQSSTLDHRHHFKAYIGGGCRGHRELEAGNYMNFLKKFGGR
ncbi:hypothetical protein, partial [Mesorhizobium sp.]|uniref:hypothetical protein n=1 Tax=Mesorhizobium sp. TaxID=1871066 RepID=UPI0025801E1C